MTRFSLADCASNSTHSLIRTLGLTISKFGSRGRLWRAGSSSDVDLLEVSLGTAPALGDLNHVVAADADLDDIGSAAQRLEDVFDGVRESGGGFAMAAMRSPWRPV